MLEDVHQLLMLMSRCDSSSFDSKEEVPTMTAQMMAQCTDYWSLSVTRKMKIDVTAIELFQNYVNSYRCVCCGNFLCICTKDLHKFCRWTVWYLRVEPKSLFSNLIIISYLQIVKTVIFLLAVTPTLHTVPL